MSRATTQNWRIATSAAVVTLWCAVFYAYKVGVPYSQRLVPSDIQLEQGFSYWIEASQPALSFAFIRQTDSSDHPSASDAQLFENGKRLGPSHALHKVIRSFGKGQFSDWAGSIYFSTSDNSNPRGNGRAYELRDRAFLKKPAIKGANWVAVALLIAIWTPTVERALARQSVPVKELRTGFVLLMIAWAIGAATTAVRGTLLWLLGFAALVVALFALRYAVRIVAAILRAEWKLAWTPNVAVMVGTIGLCVAGFETYLGWLESSVVSVQASAAAAPNQPTAEGGAGAKAALADNVTPTNSSFTLPTELLEEMKRRHALLSLPKEWGQKRIEVPGARSAYSWHGVDHILDDRNFRRRIGPFPEKRPDTMRVIIVGDSMTYGAGIREEWTYTAQLQRAMQKDYHIELLNLGVNAAQSEDIVMTIERMVPLLTPDLVIYGVCHNDFLPSGVGQYQNEYKFPLPQWLKDSLIERTRFARFLSDSYVSLLMLLGFSMDFYDDILKDFKGYQKRFAADVRRMNEFVRSRGLPPVVGMALDQNVQLGGRGHRISQTAERLMKEAGFVVVSVDPYYHAYNGKHFLVSRWEGHPDEEANAIFAAMLYDHFTRRSDVQRYAMSGRTVSAPK